MILIILTQIVGVLIGSSIAGVVGHLMNYAAGYENHTIGKVFIFLYVVVISIGIASDFGSPIITTITAYIGVVHIGGWGFQKIEKHLPLDDWPHSSDQQ